MEDRRGRAAQAAAGRRLDDATQAPLGDRAGCCTSAKASGIRASRCRAGRCDVIGGSTGEPIWRDESLFADPLVQGPHTAEDARRFGRELAARLGVNPDFVSHAYEDVLYYTWKERRLPTNVDIHDSKLEDKQERERIARVFEQGITAPVGCVLPLRKLWWLADPMWESGSWVVRSDEMFLTPGDSAMGFRLPLQSLMWYSGIKQELFGYARDPMEARVGAAGARSAAGRTLRAKRGLGPQAAAGARGWRLVGRRRPARRRRSFRGWQRQDARPVCRSAIRRSPASDDPSNVVRTALCIEPRGGVLHIFMPPLDRLEDYLELVTAHRRHVGGAGDAGRDRGLSAAARSRGSTTSR